MGRRLQGLFNYQVTKHDGEAESGMCWLVRKPSRTGQVRVARLQRVPDLFSYELETLSSSDSKACNS